MYTQTPQEVTQENVEELQAVGDALRRYRQCQGESPENLITIPPGKQGGKVSKLNNTTCLVTIQYNSP